MSLAATTRDTHPCDVSRVPTRRAFDCHSVIPDVRSTADNASNCTIKFLSGMVHLFCGKNGELVVNLFSALEASSSPVIRKNWYALYTIVKSANIFVATSFPHPSC